MGEYADEEIEKMMFPKEPPWDRDPFKGRRPVKIKCSPPETVLPPQNFNCRSELTTIVNVTVDLRPPEQKSAICSYCQKPGLHWGMDMGNMRLREPAGFLHDCGRSKITIDLPSMTADKPS